MITLPQQNGGPNVSASFDQQAQMLRKELAGLNASDYAPGIQKFALILRVSGALTDFGPEGIEKPKLRKDTVQIEIVVPEAKWNASSEEQRSYLVSTILKALLAVLDLLEEKGRPSNRNKLMADYADLTKSYLSRPLRNE
jgi:hypothetical protein